jgi:CHAD domain-containing protein
VTRLEAPSAEPVATNGDAPREERPLRSAGAVVRHALGADVARLLAADPVARLGEDTEGVHQMRVATRRLRSDLATYAPVLKERRARELESELRWLGRSLGKVRDLDVLRGRIARTVRQFDPLTREAGLSVLSVLDGERATAAEGLRRRLDTPRYRRLVSSLAAAVATPPLRRSAGLPAEAFLREVLDARLRTLERTVALVGPLPGDEELHEVRITARPLRYAAESGAPDLGPRCARLARRATDLCDQLGELHDGVAANEWLDAHDAPPRGAFAVARVRAAEIGRMADARGTWRAAWDRVRLAAADLGVGS